MYTLFKFAGVLCRGDATIKRRDAQVVRQGSHEVRALALRG